MGLVHRLCLKIRWVTKKQERNGGKGVLSATLATSIDFLGRSSREVQSRTPVWKLGKEIRSLAACARTPQPLGSSHIESASWPPTLLVAFCFSIRVLWPMHSIAGHVRPDVLGPVWAISWRATAESFHPELGLKMKNTTLRVNKTRKYFQSFPGLA